jgi:hypothetical protein
MGLVHASMIQADLVQTKEKDELFFILSFAGFSMRTREQCTIEEKRGKCVMFTCMFTGNM